MRNHYLGPPVERLESGYPFSVVYFRRGTLPQKKRERRALLGDLAMMVLKDPCYQVDDHPCQHQVGSFDHGSLSSAQICEAWTKSLMFPRAEMGKSRPFLCMSSTASKFVSSCGKPELATLICLRRHLSQSVGQSPCPRS